MKNVPNRLVPVATGFVSLLLGACAGPAPAELLPDASGPCVDDAVGGTAASPAEIADADLSQPLQICSNRSDYFAVPALPGTLLNIELRILGDDPRATNDLDLRLRADSADGDILHFSAGFERSERISYLVGDSDMAGTAIIEVVGFEGAESAYELEVDVQDGCDRDADCSGEGEYCIPTIVTPHEDFSAVVGQCSAHVEPTCGRGSEDDPPSFSDSTAKEYVSTIEDGALCAGDVDVYSIDLVDGDSLDGLLTIDLAEDERAIVVTRAPSGRIDSQHVVHRGESPFRFRHSYIWEPGRYYVYVSSVPGEALDETPYSLDLRVSKPCYLDSDCSGDDVCHRPPSVGSSRGVRDGESPRSVCWPYTADACSDGDDDNSFTRATPVPLGISQNELSCPGTTDFFALTVAETSDVEVQLSWDGPDTLHLYFFAPDGTLYGQGRAGASAGMQAIEGKALPAGTYYAMVAFHASESATGEVPYQLTWTASGAACAGDSDCTVSGVSGGGKGPSDPTLDLSCSSDGSCVRPDPRQPPFSAAAGSFCARGLGPDECRDRLCMSNRCLATCADGTQAECDEGYGAPAVSYCSEAGATTPSGDALICLPLCGDSSSYLWSAAQCAAAFNGRWHCNEENRCVPLRGDSRG